MSKIDLPALLKSMSKLGLVLSKFLNSFSSVQDSSWLLTAARVTPVATQNTNKVLINIFSIVSLLIK